MLWLLIWLLILAIFNTFLSILHICHFFHKKMDKTWKYSKWVHHFCMIWKLPPMLISLELVTEAERSREDEETPSDMTHKNVWLHCTLSAISTCKLYMCVHIYIHNFVILWSTFLWISYFCYMYLYFFLGINCCGTFFKLNSKFHCKPVDYMYLVNGVNPYQLFV